MLHIINGDSPAGTFRQTKIPGKLIVWNEILMEGPVRFHKDLNDFWKERSHFLNEYYVDEIRESYQEDIFTLAKILQEDSQDEIILWFDKDLDGQTNYIFLLYWLQQFNLKKTRLFHLCSQYLPDAKETTKLGMLNHEWMRSLFGKQKEITQKEMQIAMEIWKVYTNPDPNPLLNYLNPKNNPFPYFQKVIKTHLQRFPSTGTGINILEKEILIAVLRGTKEFVELLTDDFMDIFWRDLHIGENELLTCLQNMGKGNYPLVKLNGLEDIHLYRHDLPKSWSKYEIDVTDFGQKVLEGKEDWVSRNGIQKWLGGVQLKGYQCWRWDEANQKLVYR